MKKLSISSLFTILLVLSACRNNPNVTKNHSSVNSIKDTCSLYYNPNADLPDINDVTSGVSVNLNTITDKALDRAKSGNIKIIRIDFSWSDVEKGTKKGEYQWTDFDSLHKKLVERNIRPLYILDYNNKLYSKSIMNPIVGSENITGFANFASAAVSRYTSLQPIWELYNEPNQPDFWIDSVNTKKQRASDYSLLAKTVITAMRKTNPKITIIAPALGHDPKTGKPDLEYLEYTFQEGLLDYIDGISIHPYPTKNPEASYSYYEQTKTLIDKYSKGRNIPILCTETGYPIQWADNDLITHANYIERQLLINFSLKIPITTIYTLYDWFGKRFDPANIESNFGLCFNTDKPKPALERIISMTNQLSGFRFIQRTDTKDGDYKLEFSNGEKTQTVAWTQNNSHSDTIYGKPIVLKTRPLYIWKP
jgi:hypothetical protein